MEDDAEMIIEAATKATTGASSGVKTHATAVITTAPTISREPSNLLSHPSFLCDSDSFFSCSLILFKVVWVVAFEASAEKVPVVALILAFKTSSSNMSTRP